jgi:cytochrome c-type biogenesis protein CcmH/NrfG
MRRPESMLALAILVFSANVAAYDTDRHNALFLEGTKLIRPYLQLQDEDPSTDSARSKAEVNAGIEDLRQVVEMNPKNGSAYWFIGMAQGALRDYEDSAAALGKAYALDPLQPDFGREYAHALMCSGATGKAAEIARAVSAAHPTDAGLMANLALALLADNQLDQADEAAQAALKIGPDDAITRRLQAEIGAVAQRHTKARYRQYCR